jgi:hypothetical protein
MSSSDIPYAKVRYHTYHSYDKIILLKLQPVLIIHEAFSLRSIFCDLDNIYVQE